MTRHIRSFATTLVVALFAFSGAAIAQSYSGDWPATVKNSTRDNGTFCISLTDNGTNGAQHSGPATLISSNGSLQGGFTVVNGLMTISFSFPSGEGDCCDYEVFTATATKGVIGSGVFNYFGITDVGQLMFGKKNTCGTAE